MDAPGRAKANLNDRFFTLVSHLSICIKEARWFLYPIFSLTFSKKTNFNDFHNMRYVQFDCGKGLRFGVELSDGGNVVDLSDELGIKHMLEFLEKGEEAADKVKR